MKEEHHEIQTPKKEHQSVSSNRKSKSMNTPSKKLQYQQQKTVKTNVNGSVTPITDEDVVLNLSEKESIDKISSISVAINADQSTADISKTNLNSDQTPASDDTVAVQLPEDSVRISPLSEAFVFYDDQSSLESYISSLDQHITCGSLEATPLSSKPPAATTPLSSITTVEMTPLSSSRSTITSNDAAIHEATVGGTKSVKLEALIKHLRESMFQVLHSSDVDTNHKKLLDALVKIVVEQFNSSHEEIGSVGLFSKKVKLVLLSYLLVMLLGSAGFFLFSDLQSCYNGPTPT